MKKLVGLLTTALLAAACGGVADDDPGMGADAGVGQPDADDSVPDTTAPTIASITPADAATGVRADAVVVFEFSEEMDQLSVQNSLDTSDLGGVTFAWSTDGTTLTITPDNELAYAEGTGIDPFTTEAKAYTVILGTGAMDVAGNNIAAGAQTKFSTLKAISYSLVRDNDLTGAGTPGGVTTDDNDFLNIGDDDQGGAAQAYRGYITMDISPIPTTAVGIQSATLRGSQISELGNAYAALGDGTGVILDHGIFTLGDASADNAAFNLTPLSEAGVFANTGDTDLSLDVSAQVQDDFSNRAARSNRSQYRLRFTTYTNLDATADQVYIGRNELRLDVVYLAP